MANHLLKDQGGMIRVGGPISHTTVSLRILGDELDPKEISILLQCTPTKSHRKGDIEIGKTTGSKYVKKKGLWLLTSSAGDKAEFDEKILNLLGQVTDDLEIWRLVKSRFEIDLYCGIFMERSNEGLLLTASIVAMLGERGIDLGFDIYGPEFNDDLESHFEDSRQNKNKH